jgi:aminoglycoside 3-N-acetyltransferase
VSLSDVVAASSRGPVTVDMLVGDLEAMEAPRGATVLVHSSLSSLGFVCGGARSVVTALETLLGPDGTIVVPTGTGGVDPSRWRDPPVPQEWWEELREATPQYDVGLTPPRNMGAVPDAVLRRAETVRSRHPLVSLAALGKRAPFVAGDHSLDYGLGEGSPLARIYDLDGWVLLLGVGYDRNTSLHLSEYRATWPSKGVETNEVPTTVEGRRQWVTLEDLALSSSDFPTLGADLESTTDTVRVGRAGHATARLMRQRLLVDFGVTWMAANRL